MTSHKDLCEDIRRMEMILNRTPRVIDILHASEYDRAEFRAVFKTWRAALRDALGTTGADPTRAELLARIIELDQTVESDPSIKTWNEETLYLPQVFYTHDAFESWTDAKRQAGVRVTHGGFLKETESQ